MNRLAAFVACGGVLCMTSATLGQSLSARSLKLNYNYVYGAGGDSHVGSDSHERSTLQAFDTDSLTIQGSTSGVLPGDQPYGAGVDGTISCGYLVTGPLNEIRAIRAQGSTSVAAYQTGLGVATLHADNSGNEIVMSFSGETPIPYELSGSITMSVGSFLSYVSLQRFNGFTWDCCFYSPFLPGGQGPFDITGTLAAGNHRLTSALSHAAGSNQTVIASYEYLLNVPGLGSCPADFDADGTVDFFDYDAFVVCFEGGTCPPGKSADFDGDGTADFFDSDAFVLAFEEGC